MWSNNVIKNAHDDKGYTEFYINILVQLNFKIAHLILKYLFSWNETQCQVRSNFMIQTQFSSSTPQNVKY